MPENSPKRNLVTLNEKCHSFYTNIFSRVTYTVDDSPNLEPNVKKKYCANVRINCAAQNYFVQIINILRMIKLNVDFTPDSDFKFINYVPTMYQL